tara:strand:- start:154 stop:492 length:339 start_codon:yes stop_codon:yes gene_type:complete
MAYQLWVVADEHTGADAVRLAVVTSGKTGTDSPASVEFLTGPTRTMEQAELERCGWLVDANSIADHAFVRLVVHRTLPLLRAKFPSVENVRTDAFANAQPRNARALHPHSLT